MNQKGISTLVIAVIVVVVVVVVGVGVYLLMSGTGGEGGATPTPTPTAPDIEGATSLQFSVDVTSGSTSYTNTYMAKNIGTSNMMIRIEMTDGYNATDIVNAAQQKVWEYANGEWTDLSDAFADQWGSWSSTWSGYKNSLMNWTGTGEWTYTNPDGSSVRIYDISVNPTLADSLFQPS
jgi:FlaG/FlaF family flagellin (archaellin)